MKQQNLLADTLSAIEYHRGNWPRFSQQCSTEDLYVSYAWLTRVYNGLIEDPGVKRCTRVVDTHRALMEKRATA